jgi:predicted O-linked N-acetylglucosamine transferase (SPINDLY family)
MNKHNPAFNVAGSARKNDLASLLARAQACHQARRLGEAKALYAKILRKDSAHFDTLHLLGCCEHESGDSEAGVRLIKRALAVEPRAAAAHSNLGTLLLGLNRIEEALACFDRAVALQPGLGDAQYNRAVALQALKRFAEAVESFDEVLRANPHHAAAFMARGNALHELGRLDDAIASHDQAIALSPQFALAFINRGAALLAQGQFEKAVADLDRAVALAPGHAGSWANRGKALLSLGRLAEALASHQKALSIDPALVDSWLVQAGLLMDLRKDVAGARAACQRALALDPTSKGALVLLGHCHAAEGDPDAAAECCARALAITPDFEPALSFKIFYLDYSATADAARQQDARAEWWRQIGSRIYAQARAPHDNDRDPGRKIVLGYVSGDFDNHSAAYSFRPVLESHDRTRFEVICYSTSVRQDAATDAFRRSADRWREVCALPDDRLADCIRTDRVDILIDLSGHTAGNRLRTFARKPAPVQVTAWGFGTGTGLPSIDYMFSDPVALPAKDRSLFAEQIYDLPSLMIMEPPPAGLRCAEPPMLATGFITYGLFNRVSKFSDRTIAVWAQILQGHPTARLLIKDASIDQASIRRMLLEKFGAHGIDPERLELMGRTSREDHLKAYGQVDICLDPFPQNGGISTWEALHMGVPVVAKLGTTIASRCAGAILSAIGLTDWVANDDTQYVEIARAASPARLKSLRATLPALIAPRCSPDAYTREVEEAYRTMWARYCETAPP